MGESTGTSSYQRFKISIRNAGIASLDRALVVAGAAVGSKRGSYSAERPLCTILMVRTN